MQLNGCTLTGIEGDAVSAGDIRPCPFALALEFSTLITSCMKNRMSAIIQYRLQEFVFAFAAPTPDMLLP